MPLENINAKQQLQQKTIDLLKLLTNMLEDNHFHVEGIEWKYLNSSTKRTQFVLTYMPYISSITAPMPLRTEQEQSHDSP